MTNESYIIVGYCQSMLMNDYESKLSLKKLGGQAPSGNYMGATAIPDAYNLMLQSWSRRRRFGRYYTVSLTPQRNY